MTSSDLATLHLMPSARINELFASGKCSVRTQAQIEAIHNFELARGNTSRESSTARKFSIYEDDGNEILGIFQEHESALNLLGLILASNTLTEAHKEEALALLRHNS